VRSVQCERYMRCAVEKQAAMCVFPSSHFVINDTNYFFIHRFRLYLFPLWHANLFDNFPLFYRQNFTRQLIAIISSHLLNFKLAMMSVMFAVNQNYKKSFGNLIFYFRECFWCHKYLIKCHSYFCVPHTKTICILKCSRSCSHICSLMWSNNE
jgi:hypothetical protein